MSEWISVNDRLPDMLQDVIAMESDGEVYKLYISSSKGITAWIDTQGFHYLCVTHWIPLPTIPNTKATS